MKDSIDHLPQNKKKELAQVVEIIRAVIDDLRMIILFGSYARGDYKEKADLKQDRWSGHASDYDILVVTGTRETAEDVTLANRITEQCDADRLTTVRLIMHDLEYLNIQLAEGQFFFSDIRDEGCELLNAGGIKLAEKRELTPKEQQRIAQDHYDHWLDRAESFYRQYGHAIDDKDYKTAAFDLHQAAEAAYKTILLVFTNYCPPEHHLRILESAAAKHHASLTDVFPRQTRKDQDYFEQLDLAYIGARYQPTWQITKEELEHLGPCVRRLLDVTEAICQTRIRGFGG